MSIRCLALLGLFFYVTESTAQTIIHFPYWLLNEKQAYFSPQFFDKARVQAAQIRVIKLYHKGDPEPQRFVFRKDGALDSLGVQAACSAFLYDAAGQLTGIAHTHPNPLNQWVIELSRPTPQKEIWTRHYTELVGRLAPAAGEEEEIIGVDTVKLEEQFERVYNSEGQLLTMRDSSQNGWRITRHGDGRLAQISVQKYTELLRYRYTYDEALRLAEIEALHDAQEHYRFEYDGSGRLVALLLPEQRLSCAYNTRGLLASIYSEDAAAGVHLEFEYWGE